MERREENAESGEKRGKSKRSVQINLTEGEHF
jgi:hypothetical protein